MLKSFIHAVLFPLHGLGSRSRRHGKKQLRLKIARAIGLQARRNVYPFPS